jgi:hypothetical protein
MHTVRTLAALAGALAACASAACAQAPRPDADEPGSLLDGAARTFGVAPEAMAAATALRVPAPRCTQGGEGVHCQARAAAAEGEVCRAAAVAAFVRHGLAADETPRPGRHDLTCRGGEAVAIVVSTPEGAAPGDPRVHLTQRTRTEFTYNEAALHSEIVRAARPAAAALGPEAAARRDAVGAWHAGWLAARGSGEGARILNALEEWTAAVAAVDAADEEVPAPAGLPAGSMEVLLRVAEAAPGETDGRWTARVEGGRNLGVAPGAAGRLVAVGRNGGAGRPQARTVGTGSVVDAGWGRGTAELTVTEPGVQVRPGDLLAVRVEAPTTEHRGAWRDVTELAIGFLSVEGRPLVHPVLLRMYDSPELEHDLSAAAAHSIRTVAERLRSSASPHWSEPLVGGRYHGESLVNAMRRTRAEDVSEFLRYVQSAPGRFVGQSLRVDESYATWLMLGAPAGQPR